MNQAIQWEREAIVLGWMVLLMTVLALWVTLRCEMLHGAGVAADPESVHVTTVLPTGYADAYGDDVIPDDDTGR